MYTQQGRVYSTAAKAVVLKCHVFHTVPAPVSTPRGHVTHDGDVTLPLH